MLQWPVAYLLTCLVEIPIVVALGRGLGWHPRRAWEAAVAAWLLQCTHPLLWLAGSLDLPRLVLAELAVIAVESIALWWWAVRRAGAPRSRATPVNALIIAFIANASSVLVVVALSAILRWADLA